MASKIYLSCQDAEQFFSENLDRLQSEEILIADNDAARFSVYLTAENKALPKVTVYEDDRIIDELWAIDLEDTLREVYLEYLFPITVEAADEPPMTPEEEEYAEYCEMADMRDAELTDALCEFLSVATGLGYDGSGYRSYEDEDVIQDILDYVLDYLTEGVGYPIYRPTVFEKQDGSVALVDFPYEWFDDSVEEDAG